MEEKRLLEKLVIESNSFTEILRKLGKSVSGASVNTLKNKLDEYGIPYFFIPTKKVPIKKPIEEILRQDTPFSSNSLKQRLVEEGIKLDVCETCGLPPIWNGKPITLQLHHKNGDHNDNRLDNLQILCPNCHSQTDNFKGKKVSKTCIDCGKEVSSRSTRCPSCSRKYIIAKNLDKHHTLYPNRNELLDLITMKSFVEIGSMYGVSDNAVRKWCKKFGLPYRKIDIKNLIQSTNC